MDNKELISRARQIVHEVNLEHRCYGSDSDFLSGDQDDSLAVLSAMATLAAQDALIAELKEELLSKSLAFDQFAQQSNDFARTMHQKTGQILSMIKGQPLPAPLEIE